MSVHFSFLTWHNPVQVRHILHATICQFTAVFAQHLHDLRPHTLLNLRMQRKLVESETQCTSRRLVSCYQKRSRLCLKQIAVYFCKNRTKCCYSIVARCVFFLPASVASIVLISMVQNPLCSADLLVCFCMALMCVLWDYICWVNRKLFSFIRNARLISKI